MENGLRAFLAISDLKKEGDLIMIEMTNGRQFGYLSKTTEACCESKISTDKTEFLLLEDGFILYKGNPDYSVNWRPSKRIVINPNEIVDMRPIDFVDTRTGMKRNY